MVQTSKNKQKQNKTKRQNEIRCCSDSASTFSSRCVQPFKMTFQAPPLALSHPCPHLTPALHFNSPLLPSSTCIPLLRSTCSGCLITPSCLRLDSYLPAQALPMDDVTGEISQAQNCTRVPISKSASFQSAAGGEKKKKQEAGASTSCRREPLRYFCLHKGQNGRWAAARRIAAYTHTPAAAPGRQSGEGE